MANKFAKALQTTQESAPTATRPRSGHNRRKHIGGYFDPAVSTQLRHLAVEEIAPFSSFLKRRSTCSFKRGTSPDRANSQI